MQRINRTVISLLLSNFLLSGVLPGRCFAGQDAPESTPAISPRVVSIQSRLTGPTGMAFEKFGSSVSVSEGTAVIGSPGTSNPQVNQGSVSVFTLQGSNWSLQAGLTAPDASANDLFGASVAVSGNTLVVGARGATVTQAGQGAVYVFTRTGTAWTLQTKLVPSDAAAGDAFGSAVAIFGNTLVVGASRKTLTETGQGAAYIFTRTGTSWTQTNRLSASDKRANDQFGAPGDLPIVGDWNGDGIDTVGVVRQGQWFLRNSNSSGFADLQFFYGTPTDLPITGDWDGQ